MAASAQLWVVRSLKTGSCRIVAINSVAVAGRAMEFQIVRQNAVLTDVGGAAPMSAKGTVVSGIHLARAARVYADPMAVGARSAEVTNLYRKVAKSHR